MIKISILTPSVRPDGLKLVERALKRQTFKNWEWVVVSPVGEKPKDLYWTVYRDYNRGIRQCRGELIISWQDYTSASPDALQRFWEHFKSEPKTIVSGVGNKYSDDTFVVETWHDPRIKNGVSFRECNPLDIELNFSAFPKQAFYDVGGFDEYLDRYSSLCGVDVLDRLNLIGGWKFKIDESIRSFSFEHGRLPLWEENSPLYGIYDEYRKKYEFDNPRLNYLD
jgi:hypothetical protein